MFIQLQYPAVHFSSSVLRKSCFSSDFQISIRFVMLVPQKIPEKEILHELQFHQHGFHSSFDQPTTPKSQPKNHHHPTKPSKFHNNNNNNNNNNNKTTNPKQLGDLHSIQVAPVSPSSFYWLYFVPLDEDETSGCWDWVFFVDVMVISCLAA